LLKKIQEERKNGHTLLDYYFLHA